MELPSYFTDFIKEIRPTENQTNDLKRGHTLLRERLLQDETLKPLIVSTFLQGSYRRATAIRPQGGQRSDVDVVVVTKLSQREFPNPQDALDVFVPFLNKHYKGKFRMQGRSIGISLSYVELDLVITSAPSESEIGILQSDTVISEDTPEDVEDWRLVSSWVPMEKRWGTAYPTYLKLAKEEPEWKLSPLYIPDRDARCWQPTHPLAQIQWTHNKNRQCNGHYIQVGKAIKWWRRVKHPMPKYPKGYPIEHIVGLCCPDGITSVAEGVTLTLESIVANYQGFVMTNTTPNLPDHGVEQNVFQRVSGEDFSAFYDQVYEAAKVARSALNAESVAESAKHWGELFGPRFPEAPPNSDNGDGGGPNRGGFSPRQGPTIIGEGRFAS
jgi:hypothetical protein